jgi:hypothetical protein
MSATTFASLPTGIAHPTQIVRSTIQRGTAFGLAAALIWGSYMAILHHGIEAGLMPSDLAFIR